MNIASFAGVLNILPIKRDVEKNTPTAPSIKSRQTKIDSFGFDKKRVTPSSKPRLNLPIVLAFSVFEYFSFVA